MKKLSLLMLAICMMGTMPTSAQFGKLLDKAKNAVSGGGAGKKSGSFKTVWESEFDNKATFMANSNADGSLIIGTDDNSATVIDGNGKIVWSGDYKKITTNKTNNSEYQFIIWGDKGGYLFLFDSRSMGTDRVAVIDISTGKELWNSEKYQNLLPKDARNDDNGGGDQGELETVKYINELDAFLISQKESVVMVKAKTGEKIWETNRFKGGVGKYIYDAKRNEIIMVNYKPTTLGALFAGFKNQLVRMNAANGEVIWDATFTGLVEKELVTRQAIIDLWIKEDKLYLYMNGLQVYNIANGQKIWEAVYENDMEGGGGFMANKNQKIYKTLAQPLFTENAVYLTMFGNRDRTKYIEKHDLETGKLLWASEKVTGALCVPHIYKAGDKIVCQVGGKVEVQGYRKETVSNGYGTSTVNVPFIEWQYKDQKNGLYVLDDKTGKVAWKSEKFDKRITDLIIKDNQKVFVGDGDEFYGYEIATGKQIFDVKHGDAGVGKATDVIDFGESVVVLSEKGLAAYNKKDGSRAFTSDKVKGVDYFYNEGGNYFLRDQRNHKNVIYGIDMTNGDVKGSVESKGKGGSPQYGNGIDITDDGEYIFAFKGKKVEKIKVNN
jgi:hypothetical protein